jgi:hypothetical protein
MFDSLELAKQIIKYKDDENLDRAIEEYERDMMPRAREAVEEGENMIANLFGPGAPESFLNAFGIEVAK